MMHRLFFANWYFPFPSGLCYNEMRGLETYRSGHNELDSKTNDLFGSSPLKNLDFTGFFSYH